MTYKLDLSLLRVFRSLPPRRQHWEITNKDMLYEFCTCYAFVVVAWWIKLGSPSLKPLPTGLRQLLSRIKPGCIRVRMTQSRLRPGQLVT